MQKKHFVKSGLVLGLALLFLMGAFANALADSKYKDYPVPQEVMDQVKKEGGKLAIYDWAEWYPEKLFTDFEKEYNIKITRDHFASTDEMMTKFKLNPKTPYDLVLGTGPNNVMKMMPLGLLKKLNYNWLPNVTAYMMDEFKTSKFDPGNQHHVPSALYMVTFTYNSKFVDPNDPMANSWGMLFDKKKYAGKITMIDSFYDTVGAALKYLGYSWTSDDETELNKAKELLLKQKPMVMAYDSWPRRLLVEEEAWMSQLWTGDGWLLSKDKPEMRAALPKEGSLWGTNTEFIPMGSKRPATAHLFLNYLFRTKVNAMHCEWIGYPPVHKHVMELMSPEMKAWPGFVLTKEYLQKCDQPNLRYLTGKGLKLRQKIWQELKQ